jgi:hypothetical protein
MPAKIIVPMKKRKREKENKRIDTVSGNAYNAIIDTVSTNSCQESGGKDND